MNIKVAESIKEVESFGGVGIVVDFFRFSTTINSLISRNCKVFVFADEKKAIDFYNKNKNYSFFSEKDLEVEKFDNSPYLALTENISSDIIVVTNSGSKAVMAFKNAYKVLISSLCNITRTKEFIKKIQKDILIVPACIFFNKAHVEDFYVSRFMKNFFEDKDFNIEKLKEKIVIAGRIDELKKFRKTADKDLEIIFSVDLFSSLPGARINRDFAEVFDEKSNN